MKKKIVCKTCNKAFSVHGNAITLSIRCPYCSEGSPSIAESATLGGRRSILLEGVGGEAVRAKITPAKFKCPNCGEDYVYDITHGKKPACPKCKTLGAKALSPAVIAYSKSKVKLSPKQKYLVDSGNLFKHLDESKEAMLAFFEMLGLSRGSAEELKKEITKAIKEIENIRTEKLSGY